MFKILIGRISSKFGYISPFACFDVMHATGGEYIKAIRKHSLNMAYILLANHLFGAAVELLIHNEEEFSTENNDYIKFYENGVIDPPTAASLLIGYIAAHPEEHDYSLFNLAIKCVKASEIKISE